MDRNATQAYLVDVVKRRAIRALHCTRQGEATLLRLYLWAEEAAEAAVIDDLLRADVPEWLRAQLERHVADEHRHADLLRNRLRDLDAQATPAPAVDSLSARKRRQLEALVTTWSCRFRAGKLVPLVAIASSMELMGVRVLDRHVSVLAQMEVGTKPHPTAEVLRALVKDERRHVARCERALKRLVLPDEEISLKALRELVATIERAYGVTGALGLLALGLGLEVVGERH